MPKSKQTGKKNNKRDSWYETSSANIFQDLGHDSQTAANLLIRSDLMIEITNIIETRGWSQAETARILGLRQPRVSELMTGKINKFSVDILLKYVDRLGKEIRFTLKDKNRVA